MKPAQFDYVSPSTVEAAVEALVASNGEGKVLAGGQSLLPLLNFRMARPAVLVDLNRIRGIVLHRGSRRPHRHRRADPASRARVLATDCRETTGYVRCDAPRRSSGDPQSRHHRGKPLPCGPCGRTTNARDVLRSRNNELGYVGASDDFAR